MQNKKSLYALAIIGILLILSMQFYKRWDTNIIGGGDSWGYYLFLPATFIHGDLDSLDVSLAARKQYHNGFYTTDVNPLGVDEVIHVGEGKQVSKYTYGIALLEAPMFFIAHGIAKITGQPADGYSFIYIYMMHLSNALFVLWGLYYLRRFLLFYFRDSIVSIILCILALGTNLYYFSIYNSAMAHSYLFSLYGFLLYNTHLFYQDKKIRNAIGVGISAGLITLIRPTEIICLFIPILYGLHSLSSVKEKFTFINQYKVAFAIAIISYIMVGLPQLLYWKYATGEFFFYTYGEEGFNFLKPEFLKGLFSFRNGWLAYTPLMALALLGIPFLFKRGNRDFLLPVISFISIHLWITYSWWCWYYINGFGSRPMVEAYAILSIPLGYFLTFVFQKKWSRILFGILISALISLNLFQTYKFSLGILWSQDANRAYYFSTFFKTRIDMPDLMTYDSGIWQPNPAKLTYIKTLGQEKFEDSTHVQTVLPDPSHDGLAFHLTPSAEFTTSIHLPLEGLDLKKGDWLRISAKCMRKHHDANYHNMSKLVFHFEENGQINHWKDVILDNKPGNEKPHLWGGVADIWDEVVFWVKVPSKVKRMDKLKVFGWNYTANEIYLDDLKIEHWK